jgi:hypothetical protein
MVGEQLAQPSDIARVDGRYDRVGELSARFLKVG